MHIIHTDVFKALDSVDHKMTLSKLVPINLWTTNMEISNFILEMAATLWWRLLRSKVYDRIFEFTNAFGNGV